MSRRPRIAPRAPRKQQTLSLPESTLKTLRTWAVDGTGLAASARVRDPEGRIALIRNGWTDGWFVPGGAVEPGETPREAARREVSEETGLEATIEESLVVLEQTYTSDRDGESWFSARFVLYSATAAGEIPPVSRLGESEEAIEAARWFETLPEDLHDGAIFRPYL